ncbi:MAG: hypothetical protein P8H59_08030 [Flavobacteriales bacterium]|nr:hypothetical protein [Flavobacteriales bacterium]MDG1780886.1 hypothetical protein [Flavobacteriales bacterium]MDG2244810.1 hypothetical protein [Flavobacteriales bacterium]
MQGISWIIVFVFLVTFQHASQAQSTRYEMNSDSTLVISSRGLNGMGPLIGFRGFKSNLLEVGAVISQIGHGVEGVEISYLNNLKFDDDMVSGISAGYFRGFAFFEAGVLGTYYFSKDARGFYARPHLAFGYGGILTIGYGYNIPFFNADMKEQVARHEIRLIARWAIGAY